MLYDIHSGAVYQHTAGEADQRIIGRVAHVSPPGQNSASISCPYTQGQCSGKLAGARLSCPLAAWMLYHCAQDYISNLCGPT
jgi:hypothetical protein